MRIRLIVLRVITLCIALMLSGCSQDSHEPDDYAYIVGVGIDKAEKEHDLTITFQFALPQAEIERGRQPKEFSQLVTVTAPTISEALNLLNSSEALRPTLIHLKSLVIGENLAREGIANLMGPTERFLEFRGSIFILVAQGQARDVLAKNKPIFDMTSNKYYELMLGSADMNDYYLLTSLHQFYLRLKSHSAQPYAAMVAVNEESSLGKVSDKKLPGERSDSFQVGHIPREGGNPLEFGETAVFRGDKMVGKLDMHDTRMLAIMLNSFPHALLSIDDPLLPEKSITVELRLQDKPNIKAAIVNERPVIDMQIKLEGTSIISIRSGIHYEDRQYTGFLEEQISRLVKEQMEEFFRRTQAWNTDVAGLGYYFRPFFTTRQEFNDFNWNDKYKLADIHVTVQTKIRRTGLLWKTNPIIE